MSPIYPFYIKVLSLLGFIFTVIVVGLGAWTRLSDAGLGCPDWPTCYGALTVPLSDRALARASDLYPHLIFDATKAWPEMIHRHMASLIGLIFLALFVASWRAKESWGRPLKGHATVLFVLVCIQGAFGAFTVTMKLYPPIVTSHLLLGFLTATLIFWFFLKVAEPLSPSRLFIPFTVKAWLVAATVVVILQIALGGWVAANYAAAVCAELPICQAGWSSYFDLSSALPLTKEAGVSYEFAPHISTEAKITIHALHRFGAFATFFVVSLFCIGMYRLPHQKRYKKFALVIGIILITQIGLGISNVVFQIPLAVAVAHNLTALFMLLALVAVLYSVKNEEFDQ